MDAKQKAGLRAGLRIKARDYLDAMRLRVLVQRAFGDIFEQVDVLVGGRAAGAGLARGRAPRPAPGSPPAGGRRPARRTRP